MDKTKKDKTINDIVELDVNNITLDEIERIIIDNNARVAAEKKYQGKLHSSILLTLTHQKYSERQAERLWLEIRHHLHVMSRKQERYVGVSVATMDYLSNIKNELSSPVAISEKSREFMATAAIKDELTNLFVRDVFSAILAKEVNEFKRIQSELCLLMIDVDDFKQVNDNYGHSAGDTVLQKIGETVLANIREMDTAARYGGEEISIIMPDSCIDDALKIAERLRSKVEKLVFDFGSVTVSIGICQAEKALDTVDKLIDAADSALYAAKAAGKNCVVHCDQQE